MDRWASFRFSFSKASLLLIVVNHFYSSIFVAELHAQAIANYLHRAAVNHGPGALWGGKKKPVDNENSTVTVCVDSLKRRPR